MLSSPSSASWPGLLGERGEVEEGWRKVDVEGEVSRRCVEGGMERKLEGSGGERGAEWESKKSI